MVLPVPVGQDDLFFARPVIPIVTNNVVYTKLRLLADGLKNLCPVSEYSIYLTSHFFCVSLCVLLL
jgi:hypothetical protein